MKLRAGVLPILLTIGIETASGQAFTGTITGTVTDPNSAPVPNATVPIRNEATGETRNGVSGNDGLYILRYLNGIRCFAGDTGVLKFRLECTKSVRKHQASEGPFRKASSSA